MLTIEEARSAYIKAMFFGARELADQAIEVLRRRSDLSPELLLEYGKLLHARSIFTGREEEGEREAFVQAALQLKRAGDLRGEAEALFWRGACVQVFDNDHEAAEPFLRRSYELAQKAGDEMTVSYAARHLAFAAADLGAINDARSFFEESLSIRRRLGSFPEGEAAALLALGEFERTNGDPVRGDALIKAATEIATDIGASSVLGWIAAAESASA